MLTGKFGLPTAILLMASSGSAESLADQLSAVATAPFIAEYSIVGYRDYVSESKVKYFEHFGKLPNGATFDDSHAIYTGKILHIRDGSGAELLRYDRQVVPTFPEKNARAASSERITILFDGSSRSYVLSERIGKPPGLSIRQGDFLHSSFVSYLTLDSLSGADILRTETGDEFLSAARLGNFEDEVSGHRVTFQYTCEVASDCLQAEYGRSNERTKSFTKSKLTGRRADSGELKLAGISSSSGIQDVPFFDIKVEISTLEFCSPEEARGRLSIPLPQKVLTYDFISGRPVDREELGNSIDLSTSPIQKAP